MSDIRLERILIALLRANPKTNQDNGGISTAKYAEWIVTLARMIDENLSKEI